MGDPLKQMWDELGVCTEEALFYLEGFRWDLNAATDACRSKTLPSLEADQPPEQRGDEKIERFVEEATGATVEEARSVDDDACRSFSGHGLDQPEKNPKPVGNEGSGLVEEVLSQVPQFDSTSTNLSPPWHRTSPFRLVQRSMNLFHDVVSTASVQDVTDCLNHCKGDVDAAIVYYCKKEELMASFSSTTEETRQVAKVYLEQFKWDLGQALDSFFKHIDSEETQTSALNNPVPPLPPSQSQFEASDPTETQKSLEEAAGEGDVTVAVPGMASSQADGKAAEEGSSTETVPVPFANRDSTTVETQTAPSTIVMTIHLSHKPGTLLELPFRSDQTVRDIHNAIDQRYPDIDRGYVLRSMDGEDYMDWDITVSRVSTGDSTFLLQVYP